MTQNVEMNKRIFQQLKEMDKEKSKEFDGEIIADPLLQKHDKEEQDYINKLNETSQ